MFPVSVVKVWLKVAPPCKLVDAKPPVMGVQLVGSAVCLTLCVPPGKDHVTVSPCLMVSWAGVKVRPPWPAMMVWTVPDVVPVAGVTPPTVGVATDPPTVADAPVPAPAVFAGVAGPVVAVAPASRTFTVNFIPPAQCLPTVHPNKRVPAVLNLRPSVDCAVWFLESIPPVRGRQGSPFSPICVTVCGPPAHVNLMVSPMATDCNEKRKRIFRQSNVHF